MKIFFVGSFSPFHKGHQYVYNIACKCFGKENVWLGVGYNKNKPKPDMDKIKFSLVPITNNIITYEGLTSEVVKKEGFDLLVRGIRPGKSLEQEEELMYWNRRLSGIETILIPTPPHLNQISSSAIRELISENIDVSEYINEDVYYRWMNGAPTRTIYFGRSCSGKSTYLKNKAFGRCTIDMDRAIWNFIDKIDTNLLKVRMKENFIEKNGHGFNVGIDMIGRYTDWNALLDGPNDFDAAVIGTYWEYIPIEIRSKFRLVKVQTSDINRKSFAEKRNVSSTFLECADFFYEDPPFWDKTIIIGDISTYE